MVYFICFISGCIISGSLIWTICNRRINRANSKIESVKRELSKSTDEVRRARTTIDNIKRNQQSITKQLGSNNSELQSIIERLSLIRDKVQVIEDELNFYYSFNSSDISVHDKKSS